jgi:hypothetical protein
MTANEFLLLGILATGVILINWNTIKRDLFSRTASKPSKPAPEKEAIPVEQEAHLQL